MFKKTREAINKVNNAMDKVAGVVDKINQATTTREGQTLRGKAAHTVRGKIQGNANRCGCGTKIGDNDFSCKKPKCVKAAVDQLESIHPNNKKFVQKGKIVRGAKPPRGWTPKW